MVISISVCLVELPQLRTVYIGESCFMKNSPISSLILVGIDFVTDILLDLLSLTHFRIGSSSCLYRRLLIKSNAYDLG